MLRRLITVATILAVTAAITASAAVASRPCGRISGQANTKIRVLIVRGRLSCQTARQLIKAYAENKGTPGGNRNGSRAEMYSTLPGGWRCKSGAGGMACTRGKQVGITYENEIEGIYVY